MARWKVRVISKMQCLHPNLAGQTPGPNRLDQSGQVTQNADELHHWIAPIE
jgi:hypothetical protein